MSFQDDITKPNIDPVVLAELDIGQEQEFFVNYTAGVWYVNFDVAYSLIDNTLLNGVTSQDITNVGSVISDGVRLVSVSSIALCFTTDSSFYYTNTDNELYVHLPSGFSPEDHEVIIGVSWGFRKGGQTSIYNDFLYEDRLLNIGSISTQKDPSFFGVLAFNSFSIDIVNMYTDPNAEGGPFDDFAIANDVYGGEGRIFVGLDGDDRADFKQVSQGLMENPTVGENNLQIKLQDSRKKLLRSIPTNTFEQTTYPDLNDDNVGKPIPLTYGEIRNAPVICTNEEEGGAPAHFSFKLADVSDHTNGIKSIDTVYVDGVSKATSATDLTNATFTIATANYDPGDDVTCDFKGFVDDGSNLIENAHDIIVDIMGLYASQPFISDIFNVSHWDRNKSPDIILNIDSKQKIIDVIGNITSNAILGTFNVEDDGRYALRIFDKNQASLNTIMRVDLENTPTVNYNNTKVVSSVVIGYNQDYGENEFRLLEDKSQETAIFKKFRIYNEEQFDTYLKNSTAAQIFADTIFDFNGDVEATFTLSTGYEFINRELGDIITVELRRSNTTFIGNVKCEIIGKTYNLNRHMLEYKCRIFEHVPDTVYTQATYYGNSYYNDSYYGVTINREVS